MSAADKIREALEYLREYRTQTAVDALSALDALEAGLKEIAYESSGHGHAVSLARRLLDERMKP